MAVKGKYVLATVGDEQKKLRYDINAMADFEQVMGRGIASVFNEDQIGFNLIRALYWAGLRWKDKGLTLERTGKMLNTNLENGQDFEKLLDPVIEALQLGNVFPKDNANDDEDEEEDEDDSAAEKEVKN